ncbi:MAG: hypothetical protein KUG78_05080 [Kangiellaceae bacterium]|nr:hypothetical protein [Kangiellaceae bacterium]
MEHIFLVRRYFLLIAVVLTSCTRQSTVDDKDVGFYLAINSIGHGPLFIDSSKFALITEQKYANNQVKEIHIIDLSDLANPVLFSKIDLGKDITTIYDIEVTKDEKRLFVTVPRSLKIFNIENLSNVHLIHEEKISSARDIEITPDGRYLYTNGCEVKHCSGISIYELENNVVFLKSFSIGPSYNLKMSKNGKKLAFVLSKNNALSVAEISVPLIFKVLGIDSSTYNNRGKLAPSGNPMGIVFSEDSNTIFVAGGETGLIVYDISDGLLNKVQQTNGVFSKYRPNQTGIINSVDLVKNKLYLTGSLTTSKEYLSFIKHVDESTLFYGSSLKVSPSGAFLIYVNHRVKPNTIIIKSLSTNASKET